MKELKYLNGKRVYLRQLRTEDAPLLAEWMHDAEVTQYLRRALPITPQEEVEWIEKMNKSEHSYVFGITTQADELIGTIGAHSIRFIDRTVTTGANIGNKEYWGQGYGSEAKMLLLYFIFDVLNLRKACSEAFAFNERSIRYQKKCGAVEEGRLKEQVFKNGRYWDVILLAVYRTAWFSIWEKYKQTGTI